MLERLDVTHWELEWHLPRWLGDWLGIDRRLSDKLILGNVLGLASLRLRDDIRDAELAVGSAQEAARLADELHSAALDVYRRAVPAGSTLWAELDRLMAAWRGSTPDWSGLAARGAPLKVCAIAVCELARQMELYARVEPCLDEALLAMALYDDAVDWPADLTAGRWNAFVERANPDARSSEPARARVVVLAAMMMTDVVADYFAAIHDGFARAAELAVELEIPDLAAFLNHKLLDIDAQAVTMASDYRVLGDKAVAAMFAGRRTD